jgi:hypothetical protein
MVKLNWQTLQNPHNTSANTILFALGTSADRYADSAVAVYTANAYATSKLLSRSFRDWHVGIVGLPTSTGNNGEGTIPGSAMPDTMQGDMRDGMSKTLADTRFHVLYRDRDEAIGDC